MARLDLITALKNALERGETIEEARTSLLNANYNPEEIEEAIKEIEKLIEKRKKTAIPPKPK